MASELRETRAVSARPVAGPAAVLLATARGDGDGPAAALPFGDTTVLARLRDQLVGLGVGEVEVLARPGREPALDGARTRVCTAPADDLRAIAELAASSGNGLVVARGEIVAHREGLAGLLEDSRLATAALTAAAGPAARLGDPLRDRDGRVASAASPYHSTTRPTGAFLGVLKIDPADAAAAAAVAERLAALLDGGPRPAWAAELDRKAARWRETAGDAAAEPAGASAERRAAAAREDVASLLLCGLVRAGVPVGVSRLGKLYWARVLGREQAASAERRIDQLDEDALALASAVKTNDGFFTTFFVSPWSKHLARAAARAGLSPNAVTLISALLGFAAAAAFATGDRAGLIAGAVLAQLAFAADCADGQLARYTRTFTALGAWLDSIFDRVKEYALFAGLAIGATRAGDPVWVLAGAALALQTVRHMADYAYAAARRSVTPAPVPVPIEEPADVAGAGPGDGRTAGALTAWHGLDAVPLVIWPRKALAFPIGERFAVISLTAALFDARVTFLALLTWGGVAAAYTLSGRILRSFA